MVTIQDLADMFREDNDIAVAPPTECRHFWPEVKASAYFRNRRDYLDFMQRCNGKIVYIPCSRGATPPFVLVGNWRSRSDIAALWYVRAEREQKRRLVTKAAEIYFGEGSERLITRPVTPSEAEEYAAWGFAPHSRITILEKQLNKQPPPEEKEGVRLVHFRIRDLAEVIRVDRLAFDDFWRLDRRTLETVAASCVHNVFLVAKEEGSICGYVVGGANGRIGYLQRLGVHPLYQRRGTGEALARQLLRFLYVMGATTVSVNTQEDNLPALSLYRKLGFRETGEYRVIMERARQEPARGGK